MKNFTKQIIEKMEERYPQARISVHECTKTNDIVLHGLTILEQCENISPTIYLENYYEDYKNGISIDDIVTHISQVYEDNRVDFSVPAFDFESVKNLIKCKIVNTQSNVRLLSSVPSISYLDLSIIFYWNVKEIVDGTITITNALLEEWNVDKNELLTIAKQNMENDMLFQNMADILKSTLHMDEEEVFFNDDLGMYILTNNEKNFGAAHIVCEKSLKKVASFLNGDFIVIPSSIHEVIILPYVTNISSEELREMVNEVNITQVAEHEILSYNVYIYRNEDEQLSIFF